MNRKYFIYNSFCFQGEVSTSDVCGPGSQPHAGWSWASKPGVAVCVCKVKCLPAPPAAHAYLTYLTYLDLILSGFKWPFRWASSRSPGFAPLSPALSAPLQAPSFPLLLHSSGIAL